MKNAFLFSLVFLVLPVSAQKGWFKYRMEIPSEPTFALYELDSLKRAYYENDSIRLDTNSYLVTIRLVDHSGKSLEGLIRIDSCSADTMIFIGNSSYTFRIKHESFQISLMDLNYNGRTLSVPYSFNEYMVKSVTLVAGRSNNLLIPVLTCRRKLSDKELIELTQQLSKGDKSSKLLNCKTCCLSFEI